MRLLCADVYPAFLRSNTLQVSSAAAHVMLSV